MKSMFMGGIWDLLDMNWVEMEQNVLGSGELQNVPVVMSFLVNITVL